MKIASILHKHDKSDETVMQPKKVLELATIGGSKAVLSEKDIGSIEKSKKADIIIVDIKKPRFFPIHEESIISHLIHTAHGSDVDTMIVDGKILMEEKILKTIDEETVLEKGQLEAEKFINEFLKR